MPDSFQTKATTPSGIKIEVLAYRMLQSVFDKSMVDQIEYGGVIYEKKGGGFGNTGPYRGVSANEVDVGQDRQNQGCPVGTKPVAWFHTHPTYKHVSVENGQVIVTDNAWDEFIGTDLEISNRYLLFGYLATPDRRFWRYDPPTGIEYEGRMIPRQNPGPGKFGPLNGLL